MVDLNVTVEYERLKIEDDDTSSTLSCTTTSGNVVIPYRHTYILYRYAVYVHDTYVFIV